MHRVAVGSFTESYGPFPAEGEGLTLLAFDAEAGRLSVLDRLGGLPNPAYLRPAPGRLLHVVCETGDERAALALVRHDGRLALRGSVPVPGRVPCHVDPHPSGAWAAVACYGDGHAFVYRVEDGVPVAIASRVLHEGRSVHPVRQTGPHAHCVRFSPDGRWLLVADLGIDEIRAYPFDAASGALGEPAVWSAAPGSGPRLLLFSSDGAHVVALMELGCRIDVLRWDDGSLAKVAEHSALIAPNGVPNTSAGLRWHPSMRVFAVSNRGADRIALFRLDAASGAVAPVAECAVGPTPRDFEFSPCGRWLLVGAQNGHAVSVLAVDVDAGTMRPTGEEIALRSPSCIRFLPD
jgi:6-phosphogluconolactonase